MKSQSKSNVNANQSFKNVQKFAPLTDEQQAKKLKSFVVTHDTVVATISLEAEEQHRFVKIWWGDEEQNSLPLTIDLRKERFLPSTNELPRNTFRLQHIYDENAPNRKIILVQTIDDRGKKVWENRVIEIEKRYKFNFHPIILEINGHFDSPFETHSEFDIDMSVRKNNTIILEEHWCEKVETLFSGGGTIYPLYFTVDESGFSTDLKYTDDPLFVSLYIKEEDNAIKDFFEVLGSFPLEFDTSTRVPESFHPSTYTGYKEFSVPYNLNDGPLNVILRTDMRLVVPLDKTPTDLLIHA